jgi:hypothetical protein
MRHLAADGRSAATRAAYGAEMDQLEAFLAAVLAAFAGSMTA